MDIRTPVCVLRVSIKHRAADALWILRTHGQEKTELNTDTPLHNDENRQEVDYGIAQVNICTEYDVGNKQTTGKSENDRTEKRETIFSVTQPSGSQTMKGKVPTLEELTVEQTKDADWRKDLTQVRIGLFEFDVDDSGFILRIVKIDGCLQILLALLLRDRILNAEHYALSAAKQGKWRLNDTRQKKLFRPPMTNDV